MSGADGALPRVRVVVLNWNAAWFTGRCLDALEHTDYPADRLEVVVVDNASTDGSLEMLRFRFPQVRFVANSSNLGFAEGCNRAMRDRAGVDHVALVNNDAVPRPNWLRPLVATLESDPCAGAAAARLVLEPAFTPMALSPGAGTDAVIASVLVDGLDVTDRVRFSGVRSVGRVDWPMDLVHHLVGDAELLVPVGSGARTLTVELEGSGGVTASTTAGRAQVDLDAKSTRRHTTVRTQLAVQAGSERIELVNGLGTDLNAELESFDRHFGERSDTLDGTSSKIVPGFCGGGVLLRSAMLDEVGLFDPTRFAYYEDCDLSWRARRAGWHTRTAPDAIIEHAFGGTAGARARGFFFLNHRNWILTVLRNGDRDQRRRVLAIARGRAGRAVRGNVLSPLRHRRGPQLRLVESWARVFAGVAVALVGDRLAGRRSAPIGRRATDRVRSALQPRPAPRQPASRSGGPLVVYVDVGSPASRSGADVLRSMVGTDHRIEVVPVLRAQQGSGHRRLTPTEVGLALGVRGPHQQVDEAASELGAPAQRSVVVQADGVVGDAAEPIADAVERLVADLLTEFGTP